MSHSHRPPFNPHHIFKSDNTPRGWNLTAQPHGPHLNMARGAPESGSVVHSANNVTVRGNFPPQWIPAPVYPSSVRNIELPHHQPMPPCPSSYLFPVPQQSAGRNRHMFQGNYSHNYSSGISRQMISGTDVSSCHQTSGHGNGSYKRKRTDVYYTGSTSRYYEAVTSLQSQMPTHPWQEKPSAESYHGTSGYPQTHGANNLAIRGECLRNVRSRTALDLDHNPARRHISNNSLYHHFPNEQCNPVDAWAQCSTSSTRQYAYHSMPPSHNAFMAGSGSSYYSCGTSSINVPNNNHDSLEIQGCNNIYSMRSPPTVNCHLNHPVGGVRIGNCQSSAPPFRAISTNFHQAHALPSSEQLIPGPCYPSRDPWPHTTLRFRNVERNQATPSDRYRSPAEANFYYRFTPESVDAMVHAGFYGSGAVFDQHGDMRLDIDDMTYEELLELEERIGSVSTGLSDILISKCLTESIHCKSNPTEDERTCVICLEEYEDKDNVGKLTECGHDFHVCCIRKWLSLKNSCPICKANAFVGK